MKKPTTDAKLKLSKVADAQKRIRAILRGVLEGLGIDEPNALQTLLATRVAELTLASEQLASLLLSGQPISIEAMGRNTDRIQRAIAELRHHKSPREIDDEEEQPTRLQRYIRSPA